MIFKINKYFNMVIRNIITTKNICYFITAWSLNMRWSKQIYIIHNQEIFILLSEELLSSLKSYWVFYLLVRSYFYYMNWLLVHIFYHLRQHYCLACVDAKNTPSATYRVQSTCVNTGWVFEYYPYQNIKRKLL